MVVKELYALDNILFTMMHTKVICKNILFKQYNSITVGALCNEVNLQVKRGTYVVDGDPTDGTIMLHRNYNYIFT